MTSEATVILKLIRHLPNPRGVEVGTLRGKTAAALLSEHPGLSLVCVDHFETGGLVPDSPQDLKAQWMVNTAAFRHRVRLIERASPGAADEIEDGSRDFIYIDADHGYDSVVADLRAWWPKVKAGGILAGHDHGRSAPASIPPDGPPWEVEHAVADFLQEHSLNLYHLENYTWAAQRA